MKRYCLLILSLTLLTSSVQVSAETMEDAMNAARMRDYATMASILKKLANEGDKDAQYQLAKLYRNGLGVDKDLQKAGVWANKSAQQGVKKAIELRDTLCRKTSDCELPVELKNVAAGTAQANTESREEQLRAAARRNDSGRVSALIESGVPVDATDKNGRTPLLDAIDNQSKDVIPVLIKMRASVNQVDNYGETPLGLAVAKADIKTIQLLLKAGAKVNTLDKRGDTVLYSAISQGDEALVKLLLSSKANVNITDKQGVTPLELAERKNNEEIIALLQQAGATKTELSKKVVPLAISDEEAKLFQGWPDLMIAAWLDQPERLAGFIAAGAAIDETDSEGHTALTRAAWRGNTKIIEKLLQAGSDIEHRDSSGRTALIWSLIGQPHPEALTLLIQHHAYINTRDNEGKSALRFAIEHKNSALVNQLLNAGADANLVDKEKTTPLHRATILKQPKIVAMLIAHDAETDKLDSSGRDALWYAADEGSTEIMQQLLAQGASTQTADVHGQRSLERSVINHCLACLEMLTDATLKKDLFTSKGDGNSLLSLAADSGNIDAVNYLITKEFPLDARNEKGNTALMLAASKGHNAIVEALLKAGADPLLRNYQKQNALGLAEKAGHNDTQEIIEKFGITKDKLWEIITG